MIASIPQGLWAVFTLGAVLLLILGLSRVARKFPTWKPRGTANGASPVLIGTLALDARRRLHLVDVQGVKALVLTGGVTDILVCLPHAS
jgi:flagellar biogenesis protein FliO